ncbi:MAG: hypothetical protein ACQETE_11085 [Bacteroidota bacterium]
MKAKELAEILLQHPEADVHFSIDPNIPDRPFVRAHGEEVVDIPYAGNEYNIEVIGRMNGDNQICK